MYAGYVMSHEQLLLFYASVLGASPFAAAAFFLFFFDARRGCVRSVATSSFVIFLEDDTFSLLASVISTAPLCHTHAEYHCGTGDRSKGPAGSRATEDESVLADFPRI